MTSAAKGLRCDLNTESFGAAPFLPQTRSLPKKLTGSGRGMALLRKAIEQLLSSQPDNQRLRDKLERIFAIHAAQFPEDDIGRRVL